MTPKSVSRRVVIDRLDLVDQMLGEIRSLPLDNRKAFFDDRRNIWSSESCLRRSLEALFDVGRHILAKAYGRGVTEYKEIATRLQEKSVLNAQEAELLQVLAGYRNRMVHFYHEISSDELYEICSQKLGDLEVIRNAYLRWSKEHPEKIESSL